jgi:hypothetical protein
MAKVHLILQGKGGVGKSMVAALIAQYKASKGSPPICIDTDPVNTTLLRYRALNVRHISLLEDDEIDTRKFDALIELIAGAESDLVIDNGASSFVALSHYLISNQIPALLAEMGHQLIVHTVITGGQALMDTLAGFALLARQFPSECDFVVWLNPYWGAIEIEGQTFEQMKIYLEHKERVAAIVHIPALKAETFGRDFSEMLQDRLTFDEALAMSDRTIMTRQRLKLIKAQMFNELDAGRVL